MVELESAWKPLSGKRLELWPISSLYKDLMG